MSKDSPFDCLWPWSFLLTVGTGFFFLQVAMSQLGETCVTVEDQRWVVESIRKDLVCEVCTVFLVFSTILETSN